MIKIHLNGEIVTLAKEYSLQDFLKEKDYLNRSCAVMLNNYFISSTHYLTTLLKENDKIEIIMPMQGG